MLHLLLPYIEPHLSTLQFGFQHARSTVDALVCFETYVIQGFERCAKAKMATGVCAVFYDISKAFDSVVHARLLACLESIYHIPPFLLAIIKNYLSSRTQMVRVGAALSTPRDVISGVVQGSILGPLLFIAYINAVSQVEISAGSNLILFADDMCYDLHMLSDANIMLFQSYFQTPYH